MNQRIKITKAQIKPILVRTFPEYTGRKFALEFAERITFWDLNWGGGTRNQYIAVRADGAVAGVPAPAPWDNPYEGLTVNLVPEVLIIKHSFFCGRDMGITVYAHPSYAPKWLGPGDLGTFTQKE